MLFEGEPTENALTDPIKYLEYRLGTFSIIETRQKNRKTIREE